MNPVEIEVALMPVLGADIAKALARVVEFHKAQAGCTVSVPSWVLVRIGEKMTELVRGPHE